MTQEANANLGLGGIGMQGAAPGSAAAMLKELQGLNIALVAGASAGTKLDVAAIRTEDTIIAAMVEDTTSGVTSGDDKANITIQSVKASGTITISGGLPVANETVTVNGVVYTFKAAANVTLNTHVAIGADEDETGENLAAKINLVEGLGVAAVTAANNAGVVTVTAVADGTGGNAITLVEAATNVAVSGATLSGGTATGGIKSTTDLTGKALLLFWYNKK